MKAAVILRNIGQNEFRLRYPFFFLNFLNLVIWSISSLQHPLSIPVKIKILGISLSFHFMQQDFFHVIRLWNILKLKSFYPLQYSENIQTASHQKYCKFSNTNPLIPNTPLLNTPHYLRPKSEIEIIVR